MLELMLPACAFKQLPLPVCAADGTGSGYQDVLMDDEGADVTMYGETSEVVQMDWNVDSSASDMEGTTLSLGMQVTLAHTH